MPRLKPRLPSPPSPAPPMRWRPAVLCTFTLRLALGPSSLVLTLLSCVTHVHSSKTRSAPIAITTRWTSTVSKSCRISCICSISARKRKPRQRRCRANARRTVSRERRCRANARRAAPRERRCRANVQRATPRKRRCRAHGLGAAVPYLAERGGDDLTSQKMMTARTLIRRQPFRHTPPWTLGLPRNAPLPAQPVPDARVARHSAAVSRCVTRSDSWRRAVLRLFTADLLTTHAPFVPR